MKNMRSLSIIGTLVTMIGVSLLLMACAPAAPTPTATPKPAVWLGWLTLNSSSRSWIMK